MVFSWLLLIIVSLAIYFKLIVPFFYWQRRNIHYVTPWSRLFRVFLSSDSFFASIRKAYDEHSDKRFYGSYQFLQPSLFVRDLELIKKITTKDFDHFTDHMGITRAKTDPILSLNLFSLNGQKWREMRSTLSPTFTSSKMRAMYSLISENAQNFTQYFLHNYENDVTLEMKDTFSKYTNDVIASCAFGIKCDSLKNPNNDFFRMGRNITTVTPWRAIKGVLFGFFPKIFEYLSIPLLDKEVSEFFQNIVQDTIKIRNSEQNIRPDMIHLLLEARKGRLVDEKSDQGTNEGFAAVREVEHNKKYTLEITDDVITAQALVFFIAGLTTASSTMSFMCYELALRPEIQNKLYSEIKEAGENLNYEETLKLKYLDQVVAETLRKWPPGYALNRVCVKNYEIPPQTPHEDTAVIEKDCLVTLPVIGVHMDPTLFPDPETFNPDRFSDRNKDKIVPGSYMPFGLGPRNCIGSRFALLEIKALMVSLLAKFEIVPVKETQIPLKLSKTLNLEPKGGIVLGLKKRTGICDK